MSEANEWNADESGGLSVEDMLQDFRSRRSGESDSKCDSERDYMQRRWQEDLQGAKYALKQQEENKEEFDFDPVLRATYERLFEEEALEVLQEGPPPSSPPAPMVKRDKKLAWKRKLKELKPDGPFRVQRIPDPNLKALRALEDESTASNQGEGAEKEDKASAG